MRARRDILHTFLFSSEKLSVIPMGKRPNAIELGHHPVDPLLHPVKPGVRWVLLFCIRRIFATAASKSFCIQNTLHSHNPSINNRPYTVGVKIKDFNSGVGIKLHT